jgi:hypothetical protein
MAVTKKKKRERERERERGDNSLGKDVENLLLVLLIER